MKKNDSTFFNYDNRVFVSSKNTSNGEVDGRTHFVYHQEDAVVWAEYEGGEIVRGSLLGTADEKGNLHFCYHHINTSGTVRAGECKSTPHVLSDGRLQMHESWHWLNGDCSSGTSIIEEAEG
ncbi:hypothetical protein [Eggerthella sp. YY7918]|uniref:hypothetical protein n=1 Tax=Eggerthella sp. (strain YY7918) TaxID=502558 RepID=UPI0002171091|nr:hypothetical protein [Eggerthella sp. YY7918]BAK43446.1 hypothetical protein EGYY_02060 [Eggerthella sp. YY7918]